MIATLYGDLSIWYLLECSTIIADTIWYLLMKNKYINTQYYRCQNHKIELPWLHVAQILMDCFGHFDKHVRSQKLIISCHIPHFVRL